MRDADILHLYKRAGWQRFLLGMENTDEKTLAMIRKGGSAATDREAIKLLRKNGILSMATWVVGFEEERDIDHWRGMRRLLAYDPDQIQMLYVTPHRWTPYFRLAADRTVIQLDRRRWDYKHQVLATRHMPPWRVLVWFKLTEAVLQGRPKALWRTYLHPDRGLRHAMAWYSQMGRRVWPYEIINFFRDRLTRRGPSVAQFWGAPQDAEEQSMAAGFAPQEQPCLTRTRTSRHAERQRLAGEVSVDVVERLEAHLVARLDRRRAHVWQQEHVVEAVVALVDPGSPSNTSRPA